jgi:hypothetical protein
MGPRIYLFSPLTECRERFDELMQSSVDWGSVRHEDTFPSPGLIARCRFSQQTFAGRGATGETLHDCRPSSAMGNPLRIDPRTDLHAGSSQLSESSIAELV